MEGSTENHIKSKRYFQKKFTEKLLILLSLGLTKEKLFEEIRNRIEKEDIREETADKLLRILDFVEKERMGKGEASPKWFSTHFTFSEKEILKKEYSVQKEPDHYMKAIRKHIESIYAEVKEKLNLEETNSPEELFKTEAPRWEASRNEHFILIEEGKTGKEELVPVPVSEILKKMPERFEPLSNELFRSFTMSFVYTESLKEFAEAKSSRKGIRFMTVKPDKSSSGKTAFKPFTGWLNLLEDTLCIKDIDERTFIEVLDITSDSIVFSIVKEDYAGEILFYRISKDGVVSFADGVSRDMVEAITYFKSPGYGVVDLQVPTIDEFSHSLFGIIPESSELVEIKTIRDIKYSPPIVLYGYGDEEKFIVLDEPVKKGAHAQIFIRSGSSEKSLVVPVEIEDDPGEEFVNPQFEDDLLVNKFFNPASKLRRYNSHTYGFLVLEEKESGRHHLFRLVLDNSSLKLQEVKNSKGESLIEGNFLMFTENYLLTETEEEILVYELPANGTIYSSIHLSEKFAKAELSGEVDDTFSIYGYPGKDYLFVISLITDKPSMTVRETLVNLNKSKTHSKDSSDKNRDFFVVETERRKTQQPEVSAETSIERDSFQKIEFEDHHKKFFEEVLEFDLSKHPIYEKREGIFSTLVMRVQETHGESEEHPDLEEIEEALQKTPIIQIPEKFQGKARILKTTTGSSFTPSTAAKAIFENLILSTVRTRGKNPGKDGSSSQTHGKAKPSPRQASGEKPESRKL